MGILCLAAGCYGLCLNPTSRVPLLCDTITARSSTTNGEQELGQSTRTWIMHGTSRGQALPKVEAKGAVGEPGVLNQVRDPQPVNRKRTPSRIDGVRRVHRHVDAGSSPSAATIASLCLYCLVYQLFSGLASSPWITCYLSSLVRRGLLGSVSDDVSNPWSSYLVIARQCLSVLSTFFTLISGVDLPLPPLVTSLNTPGYTLFLLVVRSYL